MAGNRGRRRDGWSGPIGSFQPLGEGGTKAEKSYIRVLLVLLVGGGKKKGQLQGRYLGSKPGRNRNPKLQWNLSALSLQSQPHYTR